MSNWRTLAREDLAARVSEEELTAYADLEGFGDTVNYLLEQTADEVRGYIAANRSAVLDPTAHTVPLMLVGPACDLAAFAVLKRVDLPVSEPRQKAYDDARALLAKIADGTITPEPGATTKQVSATMPVFTRKPRLLGRTQESGL